MAKTYGVNTVDGRNIYGHQIASLRAQRYGVLPVQPYCTNRIIQLRCATLTRSKLRNK